MDKEDVILYYDDILIKGHMTLNAVHSKLSEIERLPIITTDVKCGKSDEFTYLGRHCVNIEVDEVTYYTCVKLRA
jgi:hypothetical protein